jgi:hypothetical protein
MSGIQEKTATVDATVYRGLLATLDPREFRAHGVPRATRVQTESRVLRVSRAHAGIKVIVVPGEPRVHGVQEVPLELVPLVHAESRDHVGPQGKLLRGHKALRAHRATRDPWVQLEPRDLRVVVASRGLKVMMAASVQ